MASRHKSKTKKHGRRAKGVPRNLSKNRHGFLTGGGELAGQHFFDLIQGLDAIVWEANAVTFQYTFVSHRAKQLLGYPISRWVTEKNFWVNHIHPEDRDQTYRSCLAATAAGKDNDFEYRFLAADDRVLWLRDIVKVIKDDKGKVGLLQGLMVDITGQKKAEEQIRQQAKALEAANRVKDEFLSFVSHELRTPLNAVIGYAGMLQDRMMGAINLEQEKTLRQVVGYSRELMGMIDSLLEATSLEAGAAKPDYEEINLPGFLDGLKATYDVPLDKELSLEWHYPPKLSGIMTDREKLGHILQNLINNAIKYTEKGSVQVSARHVPGSVIFEVSDTGIGIPAEAIPLIFDRFYQVSQTKHPTFRGVGLGLYIVKKFTELLGGKIEVESTPGKGSTFTVTLPR